MTVLFESTAAASRFYPLFTLLLAVGLGVRYLLRRRIGPDRWARVIGRLEAWALSVQLGAMLFFAVLQIILRNGFNTGIVWVEPLLRHLVLWVGFTAAVVAAGRLRHIHMDVLGRLLPDAGRLLLLRFTTLIAAAVCAVLARASWIFLGQERAFGSTGFLGIPIWLLTVVIFLGFALIAKRFVARALAPTAELEEIARESHGETALGESGDVG